MILPIVTAPNHLLKQRSLHVASVDYQVRQLMSNMLETMYHDHGVGLAAVQVGKLMRVIVIDLQDNDDMNQPVGFYPLFLANPEIIEKSNEMIVATEGCLSLPQQSIEVARPRDIKIKFLNYDNNPQQLEATGWLARVMQHEMDHLNGTLLIDYLSNLKRDVVLRKLTKIQNCILD